MIGFKLQGWVNDPRRTQDIEDIKALLRANREQLDMLEVRSSSLIARHCSMNSLPSSAEASFAAAGVIAVPPETATDPFAALDELMVVVEALCPEWPPRDVFVDGGRMLL